MMKVMRRVWMMERRVGCLRRVVLDQEQACRGNFVSFGIGPPRSSSHSICRVSVNDLKETLKLVGLSNLTGLITPTIPFTRQESRAVQ